MEQSASQRHVSVLVVSDHQIEGVDFFDIFVPIINWTTVHMMLILSIILGLSSYQVAYMAAFTHMPINKDPNWENFTADKNKQSGIYLDMPRGFKQQAQ
jgi:hypothetical protein